MSNYAELESIGYTLVNYVSSNEILVTTKQAETLACFGNPTITPSSQRVTFETQTRWNKTAHVVVYPDGSWRYDVDRHNDEIVVALRWYNNAITTGRIIRKTNVVLPYNKRMNMQERKIPHSSVRLLKGGVVILTHAGWQAKVTFVTCLVLTVWLFL